MSPELKMRYERARAAKARALAAIARANKILENPHDPEKAHAKDVVDQLEYRAWLEEQEHAKRWDTTIRWRNVEVRLPKGRFGW
jgi:hypothetical protein